MHVRYIYIKEKNTSQIRAKPLIKQLPQNNETGSDLRKVTMFKKETSIIFNQIPTKMYKYFFSTFTEKNIQTTFNIEIENKRPLLPIMKPKLIEYKKFSKIQPKKNIGKTEQTRILYK